MLAKVNRRYSVVWNVDIDMTLSSAVEHFISIAVTKVDLTGNCALHVISLRGATAENLFLQFYVPYKECVDSKMYINMNKEN